jgi:NADH dehydrogenase FAD-containing subunit
LKTPSRPLNGPDAAGDLYPDDIVDPLRRILHHVKFVQAEVQAIDLSARRVRKGGVADLEFEFEFDHLLLALGSETNFLDVPGASDHRSRRRAQPSRHDPHRS